MTLPTEFQEQMKAQLEEEYTAFTAALASTPPISIRLNETKLTNQFAHNEKIFWSNSRGYYLPTRPSFTLDPIFHAGGYYVQEASSMIIGEVIRQLNPNQKACTVLDLCAAPGGKSTAILSALDERSLLVANEVIRSRYSILKHNLAKWGRPNIAITNHDSKDFKGLTGFFDMVLVDAPCSGEGLFRKDENAIQEWSPANVQLCTGRSKRILAEAAPLIKENGYLIFSTCTYNDFENIENSQWLMNNFDFEAIDLNIPEIWGIVEKEIGYQCYPHKVKGEGLFFAVFRKKGSSMKNTTAKIDKKRKKQAGKFKNLDKISKNQLSSIAQWISNPADLAFYTAPGEVVIAFPKNREEDYLLIDNSLSKKAFGTPIGTFKREDFIPSQELALSTIINPNLPSQEVNREIALQFLRKENITHTFPQQGWLLLQYEGLNLGWVKVLKNRINNYFPKNWRILLRK